MVVRLTYRRFLDSRTAEGKPLDINYIKAELLLVLLAGSDTTGTTFQSFMNLIFTHPTVYAKLLMEIDQATKDGKLSDMPLYDEVTEHCPYYVACLKETMRLWPAISSSFPRLVGKAGMEFGDTVAPEGTEVASHPWVVHRDPNIYGPDVLQFRPERWLEDPEKTKLYNKYNLAWGYGTRVCMGRDIAMMELYKGPLQFLRKFRVRTLRDYKSPKMACKGGVNFWRDIWVQIERRDAHI
jgi:cytochrome P450